MQHKCTQRCLGLQNYRIKRDAPKCNFWFQMLHFRTPWASLGQIGTDWARFSQIGADCVQIVPDWSDWARLLRLAQIPFRVKNHPSKYHQKAIWSIWTKSYTKSTNLIHKSTAFWTARFFLEIWGPPTSSLEPLRPNGQRP